MARTAIENNGRMQIRIAPDVKARLSRAAAISNMDLTRFVTESALREADAVIEQAESTEVSPRDFTRILDLLDDPPAPNARLRKAISSLPDTL